MNSVNPMICKIYSILYKAVPFRGWQAFLIRRHFSTCRWCSVKTADERFVKAVFATASEEKSGPDLWPRVRREIIAIQRKSRVVAAGSRRGLLLGLPRWGWVTASLGLVILLLVAGLPLFKGDGSRAGAESAAEDSGDLIIIKSVQVDNRPAKTFFFQTRPDRLIVWVQKNH